MRWCLERKDPARIKPNQEAERMKEREREKDREREREREGDRQTEIKGEMVRKKSFSK